MKIICCGDLHLGRISSVPEDIEDRDKFSAEKVWLRLADKCYEEEADALLIVGDVLDKDNTFFTSRKLLEPGLRKISENVTVVIIPGNHDRDQIKKICDIISLPNVHVIGCGCKWERFDLKGLPVWGFGFDKEEYKRDPFCDRSAKKIDDEKYILMVHGDYTGTGGKYAPFAGSMGSDLIRNSVLTIAGHIHKTDRKGNFINVGSPLAFDFGELGPHGIYIAELDDDFNLCDVRFDRFSDVYYDKIKIDLTDMCDMSLGDMVNKSLEKKAPLTYYRIDFTGRTDNDIKEELSDLEEADGYISEGIYIDTQNIGNYVLKEWDLQSMSSQKNGAGIVAKMLLSAEKGTFAEDYGDMLESFRKDSEEYVKDINKNICEWTEEELISFIKSALIDILNTRKGEE
ncbi:MAG: metallophosphoesterase [Armatimonadetes bacterium]|nr:metallophosphoesterase [Candidatus Hippobium faecium]